MGSTLDKPKLLMKRNFVQTTHFDTEHLAGGTQFGNNVEVNAK